MLKIIVVLNMLHVYVKVFHWIYHYYILYVSISMHYLYFSLLSIYDHLKPNTHYYTFFLHLYYHNNIVVLQYYHNNIAVKKFVDIYIYMKNGLL